jgi:hypothetical protein
VPDREDLDLLPRALHEVTERATRLDRLLEDMGHPPSPRAERAVKDVHAELASGDGAVVVCHGDMNRSGYDEAPFLELAELLAADAGGLRR